MQKIIHGLQLIRALLPSILFNFKKLPFSQAIKLPILIYKVKILTNNGKIRLNTDNISFGMIRLGFKTTDLFPNSGLVWRNEGNIIFNGKCAIGNDSYIICGKKGQIDIGDNFYATGNFRIVSEVGITFGKNVLVGWGTIMLDTDFHPLFDISTQVYKKAYGSVHIGDNNWFSSFCIVLHSVETSNNCVFGTRCLISHGGKYEENCLYVGTPAKCVRKNIRLDVDNRTLEYS